MIKIDSFNAIGGSVGWSDRLDDSDSDLGGSTAANNTNKVIHKEAHKSTSSMSGPLERLSDEGSLSSTSTSPSRPLPSNLSKQTPLMQQYWDIKSAHEDKVLLFRMGDFFEMFHRDAEVAAPILGIALTSRNKKAADETPMCGVPHHSIAGPINKLLKAGYKVAICDQIEDPKFAKGIVKRAVTRILSPGVVYDPETLEATRSHYLAALDDQHVSFLDLTTGEAFYYKVRVREARDRLLDVLNPVEVVASPAQAEDWKSDDQQNRPHILQRALLSVLDSGRAGPMGSAAPNLESPAGKSQPVADSDTTSQMWPESARRLLAYASYMQGESARKIVPTFEARELLHRLDLGPTVTRHLEIFENYRGESHGSLFQAINRCKTSAGTRLLARWLQFPLAAQEAIEARLDRVERWFNDVVTLKELRRVFGSMGDIERRLGKIANPGCNPRDLMALAESLEAGLEVSRLAGVREFGSQPNGVVLDVLLRTAQEVSSKIRATLVDEPPLQIKNGHFIRTGVDAQLDDLIDLSTNSQTKIMELETREREATGIASLKVRFNNVFGYYLEITNTHKDKAPAHYQRKQTLANAERFLTVELEELEHKVLSAQGKRFELEADIFSQLRTYALESGAALLRLARLWSELDVVSSAAWIALEQNYVRPKFADHGDLAIKGSRHPVVEQALSVPFVANDLDLPARHALLLTGPNMAGKSTLMRQVAIAAIMAQSGFFVPARQACLPIFDRIFTRIGASDFLAEGLSTFMVEMKETAEMLLSATDRSLVILDEVGRGTSTFDGMSLAQAILEYLLEKTRSMTLFATHYHELTQLSLRYQEVYNAHMSIDDRKGEIGFLHTLVAGPANKSYGIQVARLAGLPAAVTRRAGRILKEIESRHPSDRASLQLSFGDRLSSGFADSLEDADAAANDDLLNARGGLVPAPSSRSDETHLYEEATESSLPIRLEEIVGRVLQPNEEAALDELLNLSVDQLTPLESLLRLSEFKQKFQSSSPFAGVRPRS